MGEVIDEFLNLAFYWGGSSEVLFKAIEDMSKDPIYYWEVIDKSLKLGWGVDRTANWLINKGVPEYLVGEFLVPRKIGVGYSATYFFRNFYRKVRAILRFVSKHRDFNRKYFEEWLSDVAKDTKLVDISGLIWWVTTKKYYYFLTEYKDYKIIFETYNFEKVRVTIEGGDKKVEFDIKEKRDEIIKVLKDNIKHGKIDKESLRRILGSMDNSERFRFEHIAEELQRLINS